MKRKRLLATIYLAAILALHVPIHAQETDVGEVTATAETTTATSTATDALTETDIVVKPGAVVDVVDVPHGVPAATMGIDALKDYGLSLAAVLVGVFGAVNGLGLMFEMQPKIKAVLALAMAEAAAIILHGAAIAPAPVAGAWAWPVVIFFGLVTGAGSAQFNDRVWNPIKAAATGGKP